MCCNGVYIGDSDEKEENWTQIGCDKVTKHWYHIGCLKKKYEYTDDEINKILHQNHQFICPKCVEN